MQDKYYCNKILGCSNGLTLVDRKTYGGWRDIWVLNHVTKQCLQLPHHHSSSPYCGFAFGYGRVQCLILTLDGSNPTWRVIEATACSNCIFDKAPISINGYMYWCFYYPTDLVISMDLIEEKFSEIRLPCSIGNSVEIEGHLSNIVIRPEYGLLDIWILKDVHAHGRQWVKQHTIFCHSLDGRCHPTQIVSLRNEEITIFDYSNKMLLRMMNKIKISGFIEFCSPHVNSYISSAFDQQLMD
ncbi:hypothetical protein NE237_018029 [Protea cynaroides]|uniref:F-box associated beta-propeller type 3 domain-containing protein n=1 Tax=Protea cynaroides TaxID=273540 RepID=A0A9Q0QNL0_9MAGN|nr:hypothetical protein NE237_018029 [Protea cynaroides]